MWSTFKNKKAVLNLDYHFLAVEILTKITSKALPQRFSFSLILKRISLTTKVKRYFLETLCCFSMHKKDVMQDEFMLNFKMILGIDGSVRLYAKADIQRDFK